MLDFYRKIGEHAETDHGSIPITTHDAAEKHLDMDERTLDIGFGHKIKDNEWYTGMIHGVKFVDFEKGRFIPLSPKDKAKILEADFKENTTLAKKQGWGNRLDSINPQWQLPLHSLAYNVGGTRAGKQWVSVLDAAQAQDIKAFAHHLRRKNNGKFTVGMDNRVAKELYYAGLIKSLAEVKDMLPLAAANQAGVPDGIKQHNVFTVGGE